MVDISTSHRDAIARSWRERIDSIPVPVFAVAICAVLAAITLLRVLLATGGHFLYSLDDAYIHLALAERLAESHYGINAGEVTAPSSSVIWPFLMLPGAGTSWHFAVPLLVALAAGLATAALYGRFAEMLPLAPNDRLAHGKRLAVAALLVVAGNTVGLAFTGLEHTLQVMLTVACALGLIEAFRGRPLPAWAIAAAILAPAVRYEMLAVTAAIAIALAGQRRWRQAMITVAASLVLPGLLAAFLMAHGLMPLPNSVVAKLTSGAGEAGMLGPLAGIFSFSTKEIGKKALLWVIVAVLLVGARATSGSRRWVLLAAALAALLHFAVGRFGWFHRYEVYAIVMSGMVALWATLELWPRWQPAAGLALVAAAGLYLGPLYRTPAAAHNIYEQHYQVRRFVQDHYRKPFAVNDLGLVSFNLARGTYVLDLWGLASNEAVRKKVKSAAWLDEVTRRHGVGLAVIYDDWFKDRPASWTRIGRIWLSGRRVTPAVDHVTFYATGTGDVDEIHRKLSAFASILPPPIRVEIDQTRPVPALKAPDIKQKDRP